MAIGRLVSEYLRQSAPWTISACNTERSPFESVNIHNLMEAVIAVHALDFQCAQTTGLHVSAVEYVEDYRVTHCATPKP